MKQHFCLCMLIIASLLAFSSENVSAAIQCYGCHGTSIPVDYRPVDASFRNPSSGGFPGNHRTHLDSSASPAACSICHPGSSSYTASHRDGLIKVSSRINNSSLTTLYKNTTTAWSQIAITAMGTCSNVNCHFEKLTPTWGNDPTQTNCVTCHGAPPSGTATAYVGGAAGSHAKHDQYYPGSTNCKKCHPDNTTFKHATSGGKRALKISFAAAPNNGSGSYSGQLNDYLPSQTNTFGNCTATYCHSPGTKGAAPFIAPDQAATWGGTLGCDGCHAAAPVSGSHTPHVATGYGVPVACYKCHAATVTSGMTISSVTKHVNGLVNVAFSNTTAAVLGKYSGHFTPIQKNPGSGYANCENVYCHSSGQGAGGSWPPTYSAPKWGSSATGKCGTCHDSGFHAGAPITSGSHAKHMLYDFAGAQNQNICGVCHYGAGFVDTACAQCHFGGGKLTTLHVNHQVDVSFTTKFSGTYSGTAEPGNGYGSCSNVYCHSSGTSVATGSIPANTTTAWGSGVISCSGCHGNPPSYANNSPKKNSHVIHGAYGCNKCHYRTTTNGTSITNTTNHVNKVFDVYSGAGARFTYVYNASGGTCNSISCHGTGSQPAQWGSTSCLGCHAVAQGNRAAITSQFASANSHHIQGTVTDAHCYQCHWEANSDGSINQTYHNATVSGAAVRLVVYSASARPKNAAKYFIAYTANGKRAQIQKISNHCLGCHSAANDSAQPFGDGKTPKQYAWDGSSVGSKYTSTNTTTWGKYPATPNAAQKNLTKAYSAHGNAVNNNRGWNTTTGVDGAITNTSGAVNVACYDCHNSHGSTVAGITSRYSSATGRNRGGILKDTVAGKGGYTLAYKPYTGGSTANKNKRNPGATLCLDCHMNADATSTPWGYNSTFGATQAIQGYWDSPYFGPGTFGSQVRYNTFKNAKGHQGGHFGGSSSLPSNPAGTINGLCTPCHDPHGVTDNTAKIAAANKQYAVPLLKGTFMTSPYKEDAAPASTTVTFGGSGVEDGYYFNGASNAAYNIDQSTFGNWNWGSAVRVSEDVTKFGGLCLQCHAQSTLNPNAGSSNYAWRSMNRIHNTVKGWGGQGANAGNAKHSFTCSKCHTVHNSRLPRLMVSNCLDYTHRGRVAFGGMAGSNSGGASLGSGEGKFPGGGQGSGDGGGGWSGFGGVRSGVACHDNTNADGWPNNQLWNTVTNWAPTTVVSTSPNTRVLGSALTTVTITGTGFRAGATASFNDANITVGASTFVNSAMIRVPVTVGMSASVGAHNVTVTNTDGTTGTGTGLFTVTNAPNPTVTSTSPSTKGQGSAQATVTIDGTGFQSGATVSFNDPNITVGASSFVSATQITVPVTVGASATIGAHDVTVTNPDGTTGAGIGKFTVTASPTVTSTSPNSKPRGSGLVTITINGTGFQSGATVSFNDVNLTVGASTFVSSTQLTVPVTVSSSAALGAHDVTVANTDGGTGIGTSMFTVISAPTVTSTSPNVKGQGSAQATVTINGTGFLSGATVSFNDANITVGASTLVNATQITVPITVTAGATIGWHNVTVTNTDGGTGIGTSKFNVTSAPTVTSTSPNTKIQGSTLTTVTITGTGFQNGATVSFNDANITVGSSTFVNSTQITVPVTVGAGATIGAHDVKVTNLDGGPGTGTGKFTVIAGPTVTSTSPNSKIQGSALTTVTITGTGFQSGATVSFNDPNITVGASSFVSATQITVPVTVTASATVGAHNVTVTNTDGGTGIGTGVFTVTAGPKITSASPYSLVLGSAQTTVTITGTGFQNGATVSFNDPNITLGAVTVVNATTITIPVTVTASATAGAHNVAVTNTDGGSGIGTAVFFAGAPSPPPAPTLTSPANGVVAAINYLDYFPLGVTLWWDTTRALTEYKVQVSTDPSFATYTESTWISGTSGYAATYNTGTYYWKVQAMDTGSLLTSPWSATWSFLVNDLGWEPKDSCPFVFAWDGNKYTYVTDIAGPVIGLPKNVGKDGKEIHSLGHKLYQASYIDLKELKEDKNGEYRIKIREPLEEMNYVDELKLLEIDYPEGYEILNSTSELTYRYGYANPFKVYTIKDPHPPLAAVDKDGKDILANVLKVDNITAPAERDGLEYYTFDFGKVRNPDHAKLVIDGWTVFGPKYKDIKVKQAIQPYLEVVDKNGNWKKVKSFGEPAGDLKRMVIDIAGIFLSDDHRIRIHRGMRKEARWLIDRIMLDDSAPAAVKSRELNAKTAGLLHGGNLPYNHVNLEHRMSAEDSIVPESPRAYSTGRFTRYGDVRELIVATDDMFVLMRHGDSIELAFPKSAPPEKGMQRGFMLKTKLYYKPVRGSKSIEPLPFRGMSIYPYAETDNYPQDKKHQEYRDRFNTREYGDPGTQIMWNLMPGVHEAQAGTIDAKPAMAAHEQASAQQPAAKQEFSADSVKKYEPEIKPLFWQWLETVVMKSFLAISAVLLWLKSLVGL